MGSSSLTDSQLRSVLRQIRDQVDDQIKPQYIDSLDSLTYELFVHRFGSLAQGCLEAGCEYTVKAPDPAVYAAGVENPERRTQLIENLRNLVQEHGLRPTAENFNSYGQLRYKVTRPEFGSWDAMVLEAGLEPTGLPGYVSPTAIIDELQNLADRVGAPPSYEFAVEHGAIESGVYDTRFPSWDVALKSAELDPEQIDTPRELITWLEVLAGDLGHRPNETEIEQYTSINIVTLINEFGSIEDALTVADVPAKRDLTPSGSLTNPIDTTKEFPSHTDLLKDIYTVKRRYNAKNENITDPKQERKAFEDRGIIAEKHFDAQFGSLENAFEYAAELDPRKFRPRRREIPDDPPQILREHAVELAEILDRRPLVGEVVALTDHSLEQYLEAFTSWDSVFEDDVENSHFTEAPVLEITNADLIESIEQVGASIGRPPTPKDYREIGFYPVETILRRYGSWPAALRAVGVDVDPKIPEEYLAIDLTRKTVHHAAELCENQFDHEAVIVDDIHRIAGDIGRIPEWNDVQDFGEWPLGVYETTIEDISDVVSELNIDKSDTDCLHEGQMRSQLATDLKTVEELTESAVWPRDIAFFSRYSIPAYLAAFGTVQNAFTEADIDTNHLPLVVASWQDAWEPILEDAREFLEVLQEQFEKTGEAPTMAEINEAGTSSQQCYEYYDTWRETLLAAGIAPNKRSPRTSGSKEEVIEELQNLAEELGYPPKTTDIEEYGKFGVSTYYNYYPNWQSALEDAGLINENSPANRKSDETTTESGSTSDIVDQLLNDIDSTFDK